MKHLIYLLALVLTLTACSDGLEEQKTGVKDVTNSINESEWTKYESSEYGFNFSYPSDWILEKDGDTIHIHSLEKDLYLYREYLDIELASSSFDDLKTEIENSDRLGDGTSLAQFNESIEVDINGVTSLKGEHATAIGTPVAFYYIPFGENGLWITRYNGFDEVEEKIISTFTIENDNEEMPAPDSTVELPLSETNTGEGILYWYWFADGSTKNQMSKSYDSLQEDKKGAIKTWLIDTIDSLDGKYRVRIYSEQPPGSCGMAYNETCAYQVIDKMADTLLYETIAESGPIPVAVLNNEEIIRSFILGDSCGWAQTYDIYNFREEKKEETLFQYTVGSEMRIKEIKFEDNSYFFDDLSEDRLVIYESDGQFIENGDCEGGEVLYANLVELAKLEMFGELILDSSHYDGIYFSKGGLNYQFLPETGEIIEN